MFEFTRETTKYTIDFDTGSDNLLLCYWFDGGGKKKWLVVRDTDDLLSPVLYPDQNAIEDNANKFMMNFIEAVNKELDKAHTPAPTEPQTAREWVAYMVDYELSFDGEHVLLRGVKSLQI